MSWTIGGHRRACVWLLSRPDSRHTLWCSSRRPGGESPNSTSKRWVRVFFWCRNGLPADHRDGDWSAPLEWFRERMVGLGGTAPRQCPPSLPSALLLPCWFSWPDCTPPTVPVASVSYHQCWLCRGLRRLAHPEVQPRTGVTGVGCVSHKHGLSIGASGL